MILAVILTMITKLHANKNIPATINNILNKTSNAVVNIILIAKARYSNNQPGLTKFVPAVAVRR